MGNSLSYLDNLLPLFKLQNLVSLKLLSSGQNATIFSQSILKIALTSSHGNLPKCSVRDNVITSLYNTFVGVGI